MDKRKRINLDYPAACKADAIAAGTASGVPAETANAMRRLRALPFGSSEAAGPRSRPSASTATMRTACGSIAAWRWFAASQNDVSSTERSQVAGRSERGPGKPPGLAEAGDEMRLFRTQAPQAEIT